jgi:FtsH-binding integral membrane protein
MSASQPHGTAVPPPTAVLAPVVDLGLRAFMIQVYNFMTLSLTITGVVAYATYRLAVTTEVGAAAILDGAPVPAQAGAYFTPFGAYLFNGPAFLAVVFAPVVAIVLLYVAMALTRGVGFALFFFLAVSVLFGLGLSTVFAVYTMASILKVFAVSAATFGAVSLYGYTTGRDLTSIGAFLVMGLFGLVIASVVNLIFQSSMLDFALSILGVMIFTGLAAYDTQQAKRDYIPDDSTETRTRKAITGALRLYLDFINIFLHLLRIMGKLKR